MTLEAPIRAVCFDWGGTLMVDDGPEGVPMSRWPVVTAVAGARRCLAALHGRGPLCVATNAAQSRRSMIEAALDRVDLLRFISDVFCFAEIGFDKCHPEFWRVVCRRLGLEPSRIAMVGDSLEHDVLAPRRFGLQTVWFNQGGWQTAPTESVPTVIALDEFAELVLERV